MKLGKGQGTKQLLESLKAEGEDIIEDVQYSAPGPVKPALVATDPVTVNIEEKLNVTLKRDGGVENFELQGTMTLVIQSNDHAKIHLQVLLLSICFHVGVYDNGYMYVCVRLDLYV
jgi:hypothetical protein